VNRPTYSSRHLPKEPKAQDSARLRVRLGQFFRSVGIVSAHEASIKVSQKLGVTVQHSGIGKFLNECSHTDLLDSVTHIFDGLPALEKGDDAKIIHPREMWLMFVISAFEEENVAYRVLQDASVEPIVDQQFEDDREAVVTNLSSLGFETSHDFVKQATAHLKKPGSDGLAIDAIFKAVENVYKIVSGEGSLRQKESQAFYSKHVTALAAAPEDVAAKMMLRSLGEWISACHQYRHADDNLMPTPPSRDFAIWVISSGLSHLRWMLAVRCQIK
jgi:hypothetical protein